MAKDSHKARSAVKWTAIITAAGLGVRAGFAEPKQYRKLEFAQQYESVLAQSVRRILPFVDKLQPVIAAAHADLYDEAMRDFGRDFADEDKILPPVFGGDTRRQSVYCGLRALAAQLGDTAPQFVMIHDAARPYVSDDIIAEVKRQAEQQGAAVPIVPVSDSICRTHKQQGKIGDYLQRAELGSELALVQTPQAFAFADILAAHRTAEAQDKNYDDDAALLIAHNPDISVATVRGSADNIKLTHAADFTARAQPKSAYEFRTASAFDVHGFTEGSGLRLAGVSVPFKQSLSGHSDADVVLHALCDAMLAAAGEADMGHHFPPSDPQWRNKDSAYFIEFAYEKLTAQTMQITFADISLICETPKIAPYRQAMIENLARLLHLKKSQIAVKATTTEKLGFLGRGEGIAAWAVVTVKLPSGEQDG